MSSAVLRWKEIWLFLVEIRGGELNCQRLKTNEDETYKIYVQPPHMLRTIKGKFQAWFVSVGGREGWK